MDMDPAQAVEIVDQMCSRAPGNRADHIAAAEAIASLRKLVTPVDEPTGPAPGSAGTI